MQNIEFINQAAKVFGSQCIVVSVDYKITNKNKFVTDETVGMKFDLFTNKWNKSDDTSVNYISTFLKN